MTFKTFSLVCFQALLIQCTFSQIMPGQDFQSYNTGLELEVEAVSRGGNPALNGIRPNLGAARIGLANGGLNNAVLNNGIGLNNVGLNGVGFNNVGFNGVGLNNVGVNGVAFNNVGVNRFNGFGVPDVAAVSSVPVTGPFTSTGTAELAVGGEFNAAGSTVIGGQIPVIGAVSFSGQIPANGIVSISGNCGCNSVPL